MGFPNAKKPNIVHSLPTEIIIEILSRVGAANAPDLFACRMTCKAINKLSHDGKIYKKVSFEHLYMRSMRNDENKAKFFELCLEYKNPEALLRYGMGTKIHASIRRNLIVAFWPKIEEGGFRHILNFLLRDNAGYELTTQHKFTISMNYGSSIVDCNALDIPQYGFEFVPFGDILAKKGSDVYLIDIIGQVTAYGELTKTTKSRCMTIELMDTTNDNLTCVLWGTYADEMINYINAEGANGAIVVILQFAKRIIMCCKTQQISGQLTQLTNESDDFLKQEYVKDIFDIMNMKKSCVCVCLATIEDIDVGYSWYYDGCNRCMSGVIREDDVIRCRKENVVLRSTTPRFKIKLIVADKSGDATFMMFDKEVSKLVGRTAKEMVASQNQVENNEFPEEFKSLLGKRFLFKVTVPYNNGIDQNYSYTVNSTSDEPELVNKWFELYVKLENSIVVKKESEAESVQECEENMDLFQSETDSSLSHITPQKRATLLDEHSPLGMQLSTNKKLKSVMPQEEDGL
ncbi:uncharacterized protein LOC125497849 [Beta vulgaris subsp. vulgaris]|uniref:uncharacterized protein LOC125497849 n=1 Tax=Beta vulgaris subsp. vulgaris TaxID=3555 RepID=UPI0025494E75|nr:uncharacterized protein LOC125497849 [Beta vulgaris subsp. vulgaris]